MIMHTYIDGNDHVSFLRTNMRVLWDGLGACV